jgi:hypothetical protein
LIRVHRQQVFPLQVSSSSADLHLQQLKWPIEYLYVGAKIRDYVAATTTGTMIQNLDAWDRYSYYTDTTFKTTGQTVAQETRLVDLDTNTLGIAAFAGVTNVSALTGSALAHQALAPGTQLRINGSLYTVDTAATITAGSALTTVTVTPPVTNAITATAGIAAGSAVLSWTGLETTAKVWTPLLDTIAVKAHSIDIYKDFPASFFNSYTQYHYGGPNIDSSEDKGSLFIPFCLYPGTYQPSGHINVSRAREFFISYTSAYLGANAINALLIVIASAINFLLISDGSAVLRYST